MQDQTKTKAELILEIAELRRRLEAAGNDQPATSGVPSLEARLASFHDLFDDTPIGIGVTDLSTRLLYVNRALAQFLGYNPTEILGTSTNELSWPNDRDAAYSRFLEVVSGKQESYRLERPVRRKDGRIVWVNLNVSILRAADGTPQAVLGMVEDITTRKRAEELLLQEKTFSETIIDSFPGVFYILDGEGRCIRWNAALEHLSGYAPEELLGMDVRQLIVAEERDTITERIREAFDTGHSQGETRTLATDGTRHFLLTGRRMDIGQSYVVGCGIDITDRKQAEATLQASEAKYRQLYENLTDAFVCVDMQGRITEYNEAYRAMLGYTPEELADQTFRDVTPARWHAIQDEIIRTQVLTRGYSDLYEKEYRRRDGTLVPVELRTILLRDAAGQPGGMWAILRDITERKKIEKVLREARDELELRVQERTVELTQTVEQLHKEVLERTRAEEAVQRERRTLEHLLRSSDHERQLIAYEIHDGLAQHLAGAIMQLQMYEHLQQANPAEAAKNFAAGTNMLRQGLFEARRLISGVRPPILDESGIVPALAHLAAEQQRRPGPQVHFVHRVAFDRLDAVLENAIYRIVQEGLTNACKHSQSEVVRVELVQDADQLHIEIRDWGVGFDPEVVADGCFGLEGIRERVRLLGGHAAVETSPGQGARISVQLPLILPKREA